MRILITGCAGFIGYSLSTYLLKKKIKVFGIDNLNSVYDLKLKKDRLKDLQKNRNFKFFKIDICNIGKLNQNFLINNYTHVINLAAVAGVRKSIKSPNNYLKNNVNGFFNIIETSKNFKIKHFIYASSSSVYGNSKKYPVKENNLTDQPESFYASTKKINEIISYSYSGIYNLPCTGLRFFTVYGPWGRPDMALFKFVNNILNNKKIDLFNYGNHFRDFTYIDDVVECVYRLINKPSKLKIPNEIFNISNQKSHNLKNYVKMIEKELKIKAKVNPLPLQKGDVKKTYGSVNKLFKFIDYKPKTDIKSGLKNYIKWYKKYYIKC